MKNFLNQPIDERLAISVLAAVYTACLIIMSMLFI